MKKQIISSLVSKMQTILMGFKTKKNKNKFMIRKFMIP